MNADSDPDSDPDAVAVDDPGTVIAETAGEDEQASSSVVESDQPSQSVVNETEGGDEEETGSITGTLARSQALEPQEIDRENAAFVLFGAVLVVGFLLVALQGL